MFPSGVWFPEEGVRSCLRLLSSRWRGKQGHLLRVRRGLEGWLSEKSGEVCSKHWGEQVDQENTVRLPGSTGGPFEGVGHECNVIPMWPVVCLSLVKPGCPEESQWRVYLRLELGQMVQWKGWGFNRLGVLNVKRGFLLCTLTFPPFLTTLLLYRAWAAGEPAAPFSTTHHTLTPSHAQRIGT